MQIPSQVSSLKPSSVSTLDENFEVSTDLLTAVPRVNASVETIISPETQDLTIFVVLIFVVLLPLSLFVITGNILVIIAVHKSFHLRERIFYYVVGSMAVTDLLVGFSIIPLYYAAIFVDTLKGSLYGCMTMISVVMIPSTISILHVLVIAADRYIAVFYSLEYIRMVTQRRIFITIVMIWIFALLFHALPFMGWRKKHSASFVMEYCFTDQFWTPPVACFQFGLTVIAPLCIMIGIYARIIRAARLQARRVDAQQQFALNRGEAIENGQLSVISVDSNSRPTESQAPVVRIRRGPTTAELKATKTSAIVLSTFLLCWLPAYCVHIAFTFINNNRAEPLHNPTIGLLHASSNLLPFISSGANPVIYAFSYQDFRRSFKQSLSFYRRNN
ncbi:alpha-1A adrenergic receptor-like [Lytechinus variegatus]|uniref:alpha-1A adrenergic receptor-like n=1 Tax=Lytechinus variegatus TaxID=7654 RepID=UPI001BB20EE0|nr:alpha-1A adrenergic receptor-like [Lytechinus variegatus]